MYILDDNNKSIPTDTDAYYEAVACQEEIHLEETEKEVQMVLESYEPSSLQSENRHEPIPGLMGDQ